MNNTNSPAHPTTSAKKRVRRESRRFNEGSAASAAFATNELIKALTKTPTRNIPDILGFTILTKTEIKKDTKDIEKACGLVSTVEVDGESAMDMSISRSLRPSCNPESTINKKRSRLESWTTSPDLADNDVQLWQQKLADAKKAFHHLDCEIEQWHEAFQHTRKVLLAAQLDCTSGNSNLRVEFSQLLALCESEAAVEFGRKKRVFQLKDATDELIERQTTKFDVVKEIEQFVQKGINVEGLAGQSLSNSFLSINELHHPQEFPTNIVTGTVPMHVENQTVNESKSENSTVNGHTAEDAHVASAVTGSTAHTDHDLSVILVSLQESARSGESSLRELDAFFTTERDEEDLSALEAVLVGRHTLKTDFSSLDVPLSVTQQKLAEGVLTLDDRVDLWTQHMSGVLESHSGTQQGAITRKKKKGAEVAIPLKAGVRSHTEYGACLLLSPLSQYPDRMLGSVQNVDTLYVRSGGGVDGREVMFTKATHVPPELVQAEDDAMERCRLQSCAAAAELKLNQLRQASLDLRRTATDSSLALKRSEYMYLQTLHEDASERRRIRKELVFYGIAPVHASDPPMSPLHHAQTASSLFNGVGVNKNAFRTSAANRSRSNANRATGAAAVSALSRGNPRYMNNGSNGTSTQASLNTSSPARVARGGVNGLSVPAAPTRSSRYNSSAAASASAVSAVSATVAPVDNKRRSNGRSAVAAVPEVEAPRVEETTAAKRRVVRR